MARKMMATTIIFYSQVTHGMSRKRSFYFTHFFHLQYSSSLVSLNVECLRKEDFKSCNRVQV